MNNSINNENSSSNFYITIVILLCTSLTILTNFISSRNSAKYIQEQLIQVEYNKIWWKDNYEILKELQKKEILAYLETIKKEKPELIQEIKDKLKAWENNYLFLEKQKIDNFKKDTYIKWNSWALISIIEFSDLECKYCINFHKSNILENIINKYPDDTNYIFKNFPLPKYKNSKTEAIASKCIEQLSNWKSYLDFINKIFNTTKWWWQWLELSKLWDFALELWIEKNDFEKCINNLESSTNVENEFNQSIELWINSVPSIIILNNQTWEYVLLKELTEQKTIEKTILNFLK